MKKLSTKYDKGKSDLALTDKKFNISLAECADKNYFNIDDQEDELNKHIDSMRKAIHHVELNK